MHVLIKIWLSFRSITGSVLGIVCVCLSIIIIIVIIIWGTVIDIECTCVYYNAFKTSSSSFLASYTGYLGTACMFAKMLNVILFARQNPISAVVYVLACLCEYILKWLITCIQYMVVNGAQYLP